MPTLIAMGKLEVDIDYQFFPNGRGESRIYLWTLYELDMLICSQI